MAITIIDCETPTSSIRASFRSKRLGPEHELVENFLSKPILKVPRGCNMTIFREPRIESGFPDLVVVVWHEATAQRWNPLRAHLTQIDIRVMHFLVHRSSVSTDEITNIFCKNTAPSLARLEAAEMIRQVRGQWVPKPLTKIFAARHIIAIEVKINKWREAVEQAHLNTWFASASYVMVPQIEAGSKLVSKAQSLGLGVWPSSDANLDVCAAPSQRLPLSYASWMFNEWVWRAMNVQKESLNVSSDQCTQCSLP